MAQLALAALGGCPAGLLKEKRWRKIQTFVKPPLDAHVIACCKNKLQ
jgi:hypothetical protein